MQEHHDAFFGLHFKQTANSRTDVMSAEVLADSLDGLQRAVHVAAMMHTGHQMKSRVCAPRDVRDSFVLHWQPSEKGSFCLPAHISGLESVEPNPDLCEAVADIVKKAMRSLHQGNRPNFKKAVPEKIYRSAMIESLVRVFDKRILEVRDEFGNIVARSSTAMEALGIFERLGQKRRIHEVVTGYVDKLDFKKQILFLRTPSPRRVLRCRYEDDMQPLLLSNRRELVHVDGKVELDHNDDPVKISKVSGIREVDTSDINVVHLLPDYLERNGAEDLYVRVALSDCKQVYTAEMKELYLCQAADTREELVDIMKSWFRFLWRQYALADDETLTADAIEHKATLKKLFREISK